MSRIYAQDASTALTATKRRDERPNLSTLDRAQDLVEVGDTIPLVFCKRVGSSGGAWALGKLVRLGYLNGYLSLVYVLSQGRLKLIGQTDVYYGSTKYTDFNQFSCQAYGALPPCVNISAGNVAWTQQVEYKGAGLPNDSKETASFSTRSNKCTSLKLTISGECYVEGSRNVKPNDALPSGMRYMATEILSGTLWSLEQRNESNAIKRNISAGVPYINGLGAPSSSGSSVNWFLDTSSVTSNKANARVYSSARYAWKVIRESDGRSVDSGTVTLKHGSTTLSIIGLDPDKYRVEFSGLSDSRSVKLFGEYEASPSAAAGGNDTATYERRKQLLDNSLSAWQYVEGLRHYDETTNGTVSATNGRLVQKFSVEEVVETATTNAGIQPGNAMAGLFEDLTLLGLKAKADLLRPLGGTDYFKQVYAFCHNGAHVKSMLAGNAIASSNNVADLVVYFLEKAVNSAQIDYGNMLRVALFTERYGLWFNGVVATSSNLREWLAAVMPLFCCSPLVSSGRLSVVPSLPTTADGYLDLSRPFPAFVLSEDDILSYKRSYVPTTQRKPFAASIIYRTDQPDVPSYTSSAKVYYQGQQDAPEEQYDLSEFCTTKEHAIFIGKYLLAKRRYVTHTIDLVIRATQPLLVPSQIIGIETSLATTLGSRDPLDSYLYTVDTVEEQPDGTLLVTATHFPLNSANQPSISADLVVATGVVVQ